MRTRLIAVAVGALLLMAAGCGSDSKSSADDSTATVGSTDTNVETLGVDTSSSTDTTGDDGDASLAECAELNELSGKFAQALGAATGASGTPDLDATAKAYEEFADQVPEEIRDAFRTVAAAFTTYAEVLKDVDLSSGETPDPETLAKLGEAATKLNDSELTAASAEIAAWATKNCTTGG